MNLMEFVAGQTVCMDGSMGTLLQEKGLLPGEYPERWNLSHSGEVTAIHKAYYDAGAHIVCTNTFGANSLKFGENDLKTLIVAAVENANRAKEESTGTQPKFIALDIGPLGRMLKPYGDLDFEDAVSVFAETVRIGVTCGVDLIFIETMNDSYETKAALLAAKENASLPVFVSNAYDEDGKLMTGATPKAMVAMLEGMGADAIGANCSLGPAQLHAVMDEYLTYASVPVLLKPNAGLPKVENGHTVYDILAHDFSAKMKEYIKKGVRLVGGCCGTTPDYIAALSKQVCRFAPVPLTEKAHTLISSYTHAVEFDGSPVLIGERINPTGKKRLKQAILEGDMNYLLNIGLLQQEQGVQVMDVNVGLPEIDEPKTLCRVCTELQAIIDLPLQLDTSDPVAMELSLRRYNGKAMVNSVSGKKESMERIFPLVKKYGGLTVCLTLDENGIPDTAEGRLDIAKRIVDTAKRYGIKQKDLIFDPLAMAVSADKNAALTTLASLRLISEKLHCKTSLGVSNVSFGLPMRETVTAAFFSLSLENGLSAAIMNPASQEMMRTYYAFRVLHGLDTNCADYIKNSARLAPKAEVSGTHEKAVPDLPSENGLTSLQRAVTKGLKEQAASLTVSLLETEEPLDIVKNEIIPALDFVGIGFENKTLFLPQLLMSAEAAQSAFEQIRKKAKQSVQKTASAGKFVIATVKGDIHDIGKNIVRLLLENYGFEVTDLGKDVPPFDIVSAVQRLKAPLVGLSALMTTTVPAMEETIRLLRKETPWVKIAVGGAVLTEEYAARIGADFYGKDAMATVRFATSILKTVK